MFAPINKCLSFFSGNEEFIHRHLKECQKEILKIHLRQTLAVAPKSFEYQISKMKFSGNCLKQGSESFLHKNVVNVYIAYKVDTWSRALTHFSHYVIACLELLTKNADPDKYGYSSHGV